MQQVVGAALRQGASKGGVAQPVPRTAAKQTSGTPIAPAPPGVALRAVRSLDLAGRSWPLVWLASAAADAQRVTLALGVRGDGSKKVIGLWSGSAGEQRLAQTATADLWARGLNRALAGWR